MSFSDRFLKLQVLFTALVLVLFVAYKNVHSNSGLPVLGHVNDFSLTSQHNASFSLKDLNGSVWVADFVFTTCSGICPGMSTHMSGISKAYNAYKDVRMVSITVNPENDTPDVLTKYLKKYGANDRWTFLTGTRDQIQKLAVESFKIGDMKEIVFHSSMFVLVDQKARIRGYYDSSDEDRMKMLYADIGALRKELNLPILPSINATLNGLAGILLLFGFMAIKNKQKELHKRFMLSAIIASCVFLMSYLYYHATTHIITRYQGEGMLRMAYFFILTTHTILAAVIVPLILFAVKHALRGNWEGHTRITKWLYPSWVYVSLTGVIVYLMLYVFKPA